jgi:hypothetical protein
VMVDPDGDVSWYSVPRLANPDLNIPSNRHGRSPAAADLPRVACQ